MKLSIVVPCYNEEGNVEMFYNEVYKTLKKRKIDYEIIFINDGSKDNTIFKLKQLLSDKKQKIKIINFSRNFGKEAAMLAGLKESTGEYSAIIDADLQQKPEIMLKMYDFLEENSDYDSVAAFQEKRKEGIILAFFKDSFYKLINSISEIEFIQGASDFRVFRRVVVDEIIKISEYHRFSKGIFSFVGFNTFYMPYVVEQRNSGSSSWSFIKLLNYAIEGVVAFTVKPLRLSFVLSLFSIITSVISMLYLLKKGITIIEILLIFILFMVGLLFFVLGILGEYLSKTYIQSKNRPIFIVKEKLSSEQ